MEGDLAQEEDGIALQERFVLVLRTEALLPTLTEILQRSVSDGDVVINCNSHMQEGY